MKVIYNISKDAGWRIPVASFLIFSTALLPHP